MSEFPISEGVFARTLAEMPDWIGLCEDAGAYPYAEAFHLLKILRDAGCEVILK